MAFLTNNNIIFKKFFKFKSGDMTMTTSGAIKTKFNFTFRGGFHAGTAIAVSQTSPATETWNRVVCGDFADECRLT
jgi:hypothetical protein